jgi:KxYKxGKxW signal peptide
MKHSKKQINNVFNEVKCSQFKMWKSGKNWFYGGVTLLIAFGAILVATNTDINQQVVYADSITQGHPNQEEQIPFVDNDIPVLSKENTRAEVSAEYGIVKWTDDTNLTPLTQQAVIPMSDIDPTWISWLGSNHKVYEMRKGDSFLISNVTKDENGNLVSAIATVEDIGPYASPETSIDKAHNRYAIIIENGEVTTATAKDGKTITSDHPIHLFYSGVSAPKLKYKFVKASDNKTPVTITAQTTFFDIDAAQGMKTDLFPKEQEQMFLPTTKEGHKTLTFDASKQTLIANYSGNVENIGDGSGFVGPTGTKIDNYGAGYGQSKSNWVGKEFTMEFATSALFNDPGLKNVILPIDKLIGISHTYQQLNDENTKIVRGTYRHELFGKTTTNMFPPQSPVEPETPQKPSLPTVPTVPTKPRLPKAPSTPQLESIQTTPVPPKVGVTPKVPSVPTLSPISDAPEAPDKPIPPKAPVAPKTPELPVVPSTPKLDNYETKVPKLPTPPTLSEVKNCLSPTKAITDEAGNDVNGQTLATDKQFDYTINQAIEGKGEEVSNFNTFKENVAK